jgi:hypothetical protein
MNKNQMNVYVGNFNLLEGVSQTHGGKNEVVTIVDS